MSTLDPELIADFVAEISTLKPQLLAAVTALKTNPEQPKQFQKFAQLIDRIYGTAATLGFPELAAYCGMLKKTCYDCAESNNKRAAIRVLGLVENCMVNLDALVAGIHNADATKKLHHVLHMEAQKAKKLDEEVFKFTKKAA